MDFNDDRKTGKKPKKQITNFFDEEQSDNEEFNQGMLNDDDDDDDDNASDIDMEITWTPGLKGKAEQKLNQTEKINNNKNTKQDKFNRYKSKTEREEPEEENKESLTENDQETLQLLADDDEVDGKRDFNLRDMIKSHKQATKAAAKNAKKTRKQQQQSSSNVIEEKNNNDAFQLNVDDKRFQAVFNQAAFNIDQTDPHFKSTAGTQRLIDEKLKKRKYDNLNSSSRTDRDEDDIVVKLKRKSAKKD